MAVVDLLEERDVGFVVEDDFRDAVRIVPAVRAADALVDVVGGDRGAGGVGIELDRARRFLAQSRDDRPVK